MNDLTWEEYWKECMSMAHSIRQKEIMVKCYNLYYDYYLERRTPQESMEEEWG